VPAKKVPPEYATAPDPCPDLGVERGPDDKGVGEWVYAEKHRLLSEYLWASRNAWASWGRRIYIDPFCGPGRIRAVGEDFTRPGGAVRAWLTLYKDAPLTDMFIGDKDADRLKACATRLKAIGAPVTPFTGLAADTVAEMTAVVPPRGTLCFAYVDPYNLEFLSFSILQTLSKLAKVDLAVNFCTMDLQRNVELEFDPTKPSRFDAAAPGWRDDPGIKAASKRNVKLEFFRYWCGLVKGLGFEYSREMPIVRNGQGQPIYRMVFSARHDLPMRIWGNVARGPTRDMFGG
jgi:three-Cys-motif partner protein